MVSASLRANLSARQEAIFDFVREYIEEQGYPPSIRNIQQGCAISSTSVVDYNLKRLEERGVIRRGRDISRSIEIVGERGRGLVSLPYVGRITATSGLGRATGAADEQTMDFARRIVPELAFPAHAVCARIYGSGFLASLLADDDLLVLDPKTPSPAGLLMVWSHTLEEMLIGRVFEQRRLLRGPHADLLDLGEWEPQANVLASFRSY